MSAIGVRGSEEDTQLYAVDRSASGSLYIKWVNVYNIGKSTTWSAVPNYSGRSDSYLGNDNNSIVPVSTGYWAAQYRALGSNSAAIPCFFYYSDEAGNSVYNSAEPVIMETSSQNGGIAVNESEGVIAMSNDGGVSIFHYVMDEEGVPEVTETFWKSLSDDNVTYDDFEFDYAGNLYAVSRSGKLVSVWGVPVKDNTSVIPASASSILVKVGEPVNISDNPIKLNKVYPNPTIDRVIIEVEGIMGKVDIYIVWKEHC